MPHDAEKIHDVLAEHVGPSACPVCDGYGKIDYILPALPNAEDPKTKLMACEFHHESAGEIYACNRGTIDCRDEAVNPVALAATILDRDAEIAALTVKYDDLRAHLDRVTVVMPDGDHWPVDAHARLAELQADLDRIKAAARQTVALAHCDNLDCDCGGYAAFGALRAALGDE